MHQFSPRHPDTGSLGAAHRPVTVRQVRRLAWETLSDLGMTDDEIASYYGSEETELRTLLPAATSGYGANH